MRALVIGTFGALALAGCEAQAPSPAERQATAPEPVTEGVLLRGRGLTAGPEAFYFAAGRSEVDTALARVFGEAGEHGENAECGAGPMQFTRYGNGLTVNYQEGALVGWFLNERMGDVTVEGPVQIGSDADDARVANGFASIEGSTLGEEFSLGENLGGFVENGSVSALYAGTNCFFR